MENKKLIAIGEALIDFIPDKTGCKFSEVTAFSPKVGGAPANVCGAFTKLGGSSALITQVGDDPFGHKIADELAFYGIDTSTVSFTDKASTALAFVSLENDGNRTFSFYRKPSADMLLAPEQLKGEWFENGYALHFCSVSLGDFPMKDAHLRAIELARKKEMLISFDPNLRFPLWNAHNHKLFIKNSQIHRRRKTHLRRIFLSKTEMNRYTILIGNIDPVNHNLGKSVLFFHCKLVPPVKRVKNRLGINLFNPAFNG